MGGGSAEEPDAQKQGVGARGIQWFRQEVPLAELAAELEEAIALLWPLDSLGDHVESEDAGEVDDRAKELLLLARAPDAADERLLDLHHVQGQPAQVAERRVPRPEVV